MDDIKDLKQGIKKYGKNDLEEVKADARYNYLMRLREQQDKAAYEEARANGPQAVEALAKQQIAELQGSGKTKGK